MLPSCRGFAAQSSDGRARHGLRRDFHARSLISIGMPLSAPRSPQTDRDALPRPATAAISHTLRDRGATDATIRTADAVPGTAGGHPGRIMYPAISQLSNASSKPYVLAYPVIAIRRLTGLAGTQPSAATHGPPEAGRVPASLPAETSCRRAPVTVDRRSPADLLAQGAEPRRVIGTVNTAELLVTRRSQRPVRNARLMAAFAVATTSGTADGPERRRSAPLCSSP